MKKYLAEFIATFLLTFICCGAASFTGGYAGYLGVVGIALIFGLTAVGLVAVFGNVSGCHMNPAVSFAMLILRRINIIDFMGYVAAQFLGGIAAGFALYGVSLSFDETIVSQYQSYGYDLVGLGTNGYGEASAFLEINAWGAFVVEIILTFIFVLTVLAATAKKLYKSTSALIIGAALAAVHLFGVAITGTGVNPARSFGPALAKAVAGDVTPLSQVWVFILAPLVGGILAALCYMIFGTTKEKSGQRKEAEVAAENVEENTKENLESLEEVSD